VTVNLRDALQVFLAFAADFWVDALCIDQMDVPERNQQVRSMADIYSIAACVIAWLGLEEAGDAKPNSEDIINTTETLASESPLLQNLLATNPIASLRLSGSLASASTDSYSRLGWPRPGSNTFAAYRST
jgi:Heterokaryon incompatibility protein (HET)